MIAIVAHGAISANGRGTAAFRVADTREVTAVRHDEELARGGLRRPFSARASIEGDADRATLLLEAALLDCIEMLDRERPGWRARRVGLALGTSSGGMRSFEAGLPGIAATYAGPVAAAVSRAFAPATLVLAACASSAIAIGLGRAWLEDDRADIVLAGGFDAVSVFVASGFEALRATCGERGPRPFRRDRDGLALGEGAAVIALARAREARAWIAGFGITCDAHHLTAPDPSGAGLARAAAVADAEAGAPAIGLVSAHGTATMQNDAAEARALAQLAPAPVFSFKGTVGHTLGAAGALETLATLDALERGLVPATFGTGELEAGADIREHTAPSDARAALKLASAFGGANAALVLTRDPPAFALPPSRRDVFMTAGVTITDADIEPGLLASRTGYPIDRIARGDDLVRRSLAIVHALEARYGSLRGGGIIVGHGLATIETNARFLARLPRAEPRRFPYTTPNAAAGECAVAFGLRGPAFAVGGGPHGGLEAIGVAADLVRSGACDRIAVVAVDEAGAASELLAPGTRSGAVGVIVQSAQAETRLERWGVSYAPRAAPEPLPPMEAHRALLPLLTGATELGAVVPWGGEATVILRRS